MFDTPLEPEFGRLTDRKPPFRYSALTRVAFSDTDAQGIVYYGRYMPYFDLGRTEYHRHLGGAPARSYGYDFVMRALAVEYFAPARFDDLIEIFVRMRRLGSTSITYEFQAWRVADDALMVTALQTSVHVDLARHVATPVPQGFRELVAGFEGDALEDAAGGER
jgi:acyl-CoA thioester hydrolase